MRQKLSPSTISVDTQLTCNLFIETRYAPCQAIYSRTKATHCYYATDQTRFICPQQVAETTAAGRFLAEIHLELLHPALSPHHSTSFSLTFADVALLRVVLAYLLACQKDNTTVIFSVSRPLLVRVQHCHAHYSVPIVVHTLHTRKKNPVSNRGQCLLILWLGDVREMS